LARSRHHRHLHSFPTRRSSDLLVARLPVRAAGRGAATVVLRVPRAGRLTGATRTSGRTAAGGALLLRPAGLLVGVVGARGRALRSEEHTSELQSRENLVCRLLL